MNRKTKELQDKIISTLKSGFGVRDTARICSCNKNTAARYRNLLREQGQLPLCTCGKQIGHNGWCSARLQQHPLRKKFLRERWGLLGVRLDAAPVPIPHIPMPAPRLIKGHSYGA